jgi:hypothetical protein
MRCTGDCTITDLAELPNISRPAVYRTLPASGKRSSATQSKPMTLIPRFARERQS